MAESIKKRNTTAKKTVAPQEEALVEKTVVEEKKIYQPNDEINCFSITAGELIMIGRKTRNVYRWSNYGDVTPVEYQDLKAEKLNSKSQYIYDPLFVIDDDELLATPEFKNVAEVYGDALSTEDINAVFDLDAGSFQRTLINMPKGFQNTIKSIAVSKIQSGSLDSIKKIKIIDEVCGTDLHSYLND